MTHCKTGSKGECLLAATSVESYLLVHLVSIPDVGIWMRKLGGNDNQTGEMWLE